jgi:hypothetical protein
LGCWDLVAQLAGDETTPEVSNAYLALGKPRLHDVHLVDLALDDNSPPPVAASLVMALLVEFGDM